MHGGSADRTLRDVRERSLWTRLREVASPGLVDKLIAFGFMAFGLIVFFTVEPARDTTAPDALGAALIVMATGALVYRRRWPVAVMTVTSLASISVHMLGSADSGLPFAAVLALYTMA